MSTCAFNTLEEAENLQKCGFSEGQAKGLVQVILVSQANLVTKQDLKEFEYHLKEELRQEINEKFNEVGQKFEAIDRKFEAVDRRFEGIERSILKLDNKILKMTISLGAVNIAGLGFFTSLIKWLN